MPAPGVFFAQFGQELGERLLVFLEIVAGQGLTGLFNQISNTAKNFKLWFRGHGVVGCCCGRGLEMHVFSAGRRQIA